MRKNLKKLLFLTAATVLLCASMCILASAEGAVARVESTSTTYDDFRAAITAAAENDTVTLLQDFTIPEHTGIVYLDAGGTKKYTVVGATPETKLIFGSYGAYWGNTDVTYKNMTISFDRTSTVAIGNNMKVTFGDGCTITSGLTDTIDTVIQPQGNAVVTFAPGCTVKDISFKTFASVCTSSTFDVKGVTFDNVKIASSFAACWDTSIVKVATVDASGVLPQSGFNALFVRGSTTNITLTGKIKTSATPFAVLNSTEAQIVGKDVAEIGVTTANASLWYNKAELVDVELRGTKSTYLGIYNAMANLSTKDSGYVVTLNGDQTITGKINSQNPIAERNFTLDGKGHKLTIAADCGTVWGNGNCEFQNVTLAVKNQGFGNGSQITLGNGCVLTSIDSEANYGIRVQNTAKLTVKTGSSFKNATFADYIIGTAGESSSITVEEGVTTDNVTVTSGITVSGNSNNSVASTLGAKAKSGNTYCLNFLAAVTAASDGADDGSFVGTTIELLDDIEFNGTVPGTKDYTVVGNNKKLKINSGFAYGGDAAQNVHSTVKMKNMDIEFNVSGGVPMVPYSSYITFENVNFTSLKDIETAFYISDGSTVTATNCTFKNMNFVGKSSDGLQTAVFKVANGELTLNNTEISGNIGQSGGAVGVYGTSKFTMNGGTINDNQAWSGAGVKVWSANASVTISGDAVIYGNKLRNNGNPASNIELNDFRALDVTGLTSNAKVGVHYNTDGSLGKVNAFAEGTVIGEGVSLASTQSVISDGEDGAIAYVTSDGKLTMVKKPTLTVNYDSGVYNKESETYGVVRALSTFSNVTEGTAIESCGTYFVKTIPSAGAVPDAENKKHVIENPTVSAGSGFMTDCYGITTPSESSVVAVSWYKLAGVNEYIYTIGEVKTVDTTKTVEYTEA